MKFVIFKVQKKATTTNSLSYSVTGGLAIKETSMDNYDIDIQLNLFFQKNPHLQFVDIKQLNNGEYIERYLLITKQTLNDDPNETNN